VTDAVLLPSAAPSRVAVLAAAREITDRGLTVGTASNVSARLDAAHFIVTPTGRHYATLEPGDLPVVRADGTWYGRARPSSEWRFHRDIYAARPEVGAIVHTHSRHATALACTGSEIPPFHYVVARAGGRDIRCAPYHTFGTQALSTAAVTALVDRRACLLSHHGVIALGSTPADALALAAEVEELAAQYLAARALGPVPLLDAAEMDRVIEKFRTYGTDDAPDDDLVYGGPVPTTRGAGS
jgi:L-fuculose-phosphate aldolase